MRSGGLLARFAGRRPYRRCRSHLQAADWLAYALSSTGTAGAAITSSRVRSHAKAALRSAAHGCLPVQKRTAWPANLLKRGSRKKWSQLGRELATLISGGRPWRWLSDYAVSGYHCAPYQPLLRNQVFSTCAADHLHRNPLHGCCWNQRRRGRAESVNTALRRSMGGVRPAGFVPLAAGPARGRRRRCSSVHRSKRATRKPTPPRLGTPHRPPWGWVRQSFGLALI